MGLAASQAKLLSITSRLSDNELRSQSITAAKLALAGQTSEASRKYINALNKSEYIYRTYDQTGDKAYVALTGAQLSTYGPLKNQYALVNLDGQVLVSELDGANYENSDNINEFLDKYGIERIPTGETRTVENPAYSDAYTKWLGDRNEWISLKPDPTDEKYWTEVADKDSELYNKYVNASHNCLNTALTGGSGCYMHVLAHLLDLTTDDYGNPTGTWPKTYETSVPGITITYGKNQITGSAIYYSELNGVHNKTKDMVEVSDAVCNTYKGKVLYATADSEFVSQFDLTEDDPKPGTINPGDPGYQEYVNKRLLSNYTYDEAGNIVLKTLEQKCRDMAYLIDNYASMGVPYVTGHGHDNGMYDLIQSFQEDMQLAFTENIFDQEQFDKDMGEWRELEPDPLDVPATIDEEIYKYSDEDQAQWYVNLWHRMNGESQEKDGMQTTTTTTNVTTNEYGTTSLYPSTTVTTTKTGPRWKVLEDGLMNSQDWLKYALESGAVSLERVNYTNPTEEGTGLKDATWTSIIYTNALDISEQSDEKAIARAEAEYEQKSREIESKDKQYDSMLKLLDTEHSALQQEYESAKAVITKNTERTLKMYSA